MAKVAMPKSSKAYQGRAPKTEKIVEVKAVKKSSYIPSPPSTAGDEMDVKMKLDWVKYQAGQGVEAGVPPEFLKFVTFELIRDSMLAGAKEKGRAALEWYQWSPFAPDAAAITLLEIISREEKEAAREAAKLKKVELNDGEDF